MPCILFKNAQTGEIRSVVVEVGESVQHRVGEVLLEVRNDCDRPNLEQQPIEKHIPLRQELDDALGSGAGDWIRTMVKPLAKFVGKDRCSQCEARRIATNAYAKLKVKYGQLEALRIIKELWAMSSDPDATLQKLKEHLDG
jgi:hypothetical protein